MNQKKKKLKNNNELLQLIQRDCRHGNKEGYLLMLLKGILLNMKLLRP